MLYAVFASYFAGVMVRLMLTLTPIVCVLASVTFSRTFDAFLGDEDLQPPIETQGKTGTGETSETAEPSSPVVSKKGKKKRKEEKVD